MDKADDGTIIELNTSSSGVNINTLKFLSKDVISWVANDGFF